MPIQNPKFLYVIFLSLVFPKQNYSPIPNPKFLSFFPLKQNYIPVPKPKFSFFKIRPF